MSLGVLLLTACARLAGAQTYVWTDERGVVHAAADPSEVPASQREKAIRDAANRRPAVTSDSEPGDAPAPARAAPRPTRHRAAQDEAPAAPARSYEGDAPAETRGGGVGLDAKPEVTPGPQPSNGAPEPKKFTGKGLPPPDPGFEWHCATDPEGGPPKCEQFEKKSSKRERRADARRKAREALGVQGTDEFDPEIAKRVDERAEQEFKKTTPVPKTKAPARSEDDEDYGDEGDSSDEPED